MALARRGLGNDGDVQYPKLADIRKHKHGDIQHTRPQAWQSTPPTAFPIPTALQSPALTVGRLGRKGMKCLRNGQAPISERKAAISSAIRASCTCARALSRYRFYPPTNTSLGPLPPLHPNKHAPARAPTASRVAGGRWCVVCGVWCVVCGVWCVYATNSRGT